MDEGRLRFEHFRAGLIGVELMIRKQEAQI